MTATSQNACGPLALAGAHGPSTDVERGGRLARHDEKEAGSRDGRQSRQVIRVNVATGRALRCVLPSYLDAPLTSGQLTDVERLLLHDEQLPATYNQALAVIAASKVIAHGTANEVPVILAKLLLQELDRVNTALAVQMRHLARLQEDRVLHAPATV